MLNKENQELLQAIETLISTRFDDYDRKLDQRFDDYDRKLDQRFDDYDRKLDQRFDDYDRKLDQRFDDYDRKLDQRFDENNQAIDQRFDENNQAIDQRFQSTTAYLLSEIDARIAKSESMLLDEIERIHMQVWDNSKKLKQLQSDLSALRAREQNFSIIYSYLNKLDTRVSRLESVVSPT